MEFQKFDKPVNPETQPLYLSIDMSYPEEPQVVVMNADGTVRYSFLGIRKDGSIVRYAGKSKEKREDGFKVNEQGQVKDRCPASPYEFFF